MKSADNNRAYTSISDYGEFKLIDFLTKDVEILQKSTLRGIGDDAAILNYENRNTVVTTDLLLEGIHFDLMYTPMKHLGYKSVVVNVSDIYAMNATPKQITVSVGVSKRFSVEMLQDFYEGISLACQHYGVDLIGGDTSASKTGLVISVTAIGEAEPGKIVYRNGAKPNDLVCVSGDLGAAYLGLQLLEREKNIFESNPDIQPDLSGHDYIVSRQLKPEARHDIISFFSEKGIIPNAMIDISDGLSSELLHICSQSKCGCDVYEEKIPVAPESKDFAKELEMDTTICAMSGGEDYELLFTVPLDCYETIELHDDISVIGHITEEDSGCHLIARDKTRVPIIAQGWNSMEE